MNDKIEIIGKNTLIQHGKLNERIYLMKLHEQDFPAVIDEINNLARSESYSKIFCKVPCWAAPRFVSGGFIFEAHIPNFYNSSESVFFMSKFLNPDRLLNIEYEKLNELSRQLVQIKNTDHSIKPAPGFAIEQLTSEYAEEITGVYSQVFDSYPFPIFDPDYIRQTMQNDIQYFGALKDGKIAALASSEIDRKSGNAEMTDFATLPGYRGNNLSVVLLEEMEKKMKKQAICTLYTIARLNSIPMNRTFLKMNYKYGGTLIKNTNIAGNIESMNVHYKHI